MSVSNWRSELCPPGAHLGAESRQANFFTIQRLLHGNVMKAGPGWPRGERGAKYMYTYVHTHTVLHSGGISLDYPIKKATVTSVALPIIHYWLFCFVVCFKVLSHKLPHCDWIRCHCFNLFDLLFRFVLRPPTTFIVKSETQGK